MCQITEFRVLVEMISKQEAMLRMPDLNNVLSPEERRFVMRDMCVCEYHKNEIIYCEGEIPSSLMCLLEGKVKIYVEGVGGRSQIVRVVRSVEYFAYRAAFSNEPYVTSAAAFESSVIACIPIALIKKLIMQNTALAWFFIKELSNSLGQSDKRTVNLTQKHIRGRLAESILFLKESYGVEEDGCTLSIYLSREDMANLSNMTTSNAIRTLSMFAQEKLIAIDGRKIKIIDQQGLENISRCG